MIDESNILMHKVGISFLNLFHNTDNKKPNGIKNIILSTVGISIPLLRGM